jgi:hypothetical protein
VVVQELRSYLLDRHIRLGRRTLSLAYRLEEEVVEVDCILQVRVVALDLLVALDQRGSVGRS